MTYSHSKRSALLLVLSSLLLQQPWMAGAVITREDPSSAIVRDPARTKFFVSLFDKGDCAGTIIGDSFVVTAAHCVCGARNGITAIDYRDSRLSAVKSYQNPARRFNCNRDGPNRNDVALLEFDAGVFQGHDPRRVYSRSDEVSKTIWILGRGISGQPDDYPTAQSCRRGTDDGQLREGFNVVDNANRGVMTYDMSPSGSGTQLAREAIAQDGDSGGPALIFSDGEWMVAGANSGTNENNSCDWGSVDIFCRLSEHAAWIEQATNTALDDATRGLWFTYREPTPTRAPVPRPTQQPVPAPTQQPVRRPTRVPSCPTNHQPPTRAPIRPTPQPVRPTRAPVRPTPQPVRPTRAPVRPTPQPVRPTPRPVRPTRQPVRPNRNTGVPTDFPTEVSSEVSSSEEGFRRFGDDASSSEEESNDIEYAGTDAPTETEFPTETGFPTETFFPTGTSSEESSMEFSEESSNESSEGSSEESSEQFSEDASEEESSNDDGRIQTSVPTSASSTESSGASSAESSSASSSTSSSASSGNDDEMAPGQLRKTVFLDRNVPEEQKSSLTTETTNNNSATPYLEAILDQGDLEEAIAAQPEIGEFVPSASAASAVAWGNPFGLAVSLLSGMALVLVVV